MIQKYFFNHNVLASISVPYLHEHDEAHEEGEEADTKKKQLSAVLPAEHGWVHVDDRCDQALHTHKLIDR